MPHSIFLAALISTYVLSQSMLISLPNGNKVSPEIEQVAYERNLGLAPQSVGISKDPQMIAPVIAATSALILDLNSGTVLHSKDAYDALPIASLTKIMTALLVLEDNRLSESTKISDKAAAMIGKKVWLYPGDTMIVGDLLKTSLIDSASDATMALAEFVGGNEKDFVVKMNQKALDLKLASTHFENPIGFDDSDNYSTAYEMALLTKAAWEYPLFRELVGTKTASVQSAGGTTYKLVNTNELLSSYLKVYGVKTGTTAAAGQSLITIGEVDGGRQILTVILNSPDRYHESKVLFDWAERAYSFN